MAEVGGDGAAPVDVAGPGPAGAGGPVEGAAHRLAGGGRQAGFEPVGDRAHDGPGRLPGVLGNGPPQGEQRADEMDVGLHGAEQLGFEEQLGQTETFHGVAL